jgi:hypothetical protein
MNPWGYNPFGPIKALVLFACATSVVLGLALDRGLAGNLLARLRKSPVAWSVAALWAIIALSTLMSVTPLQSLLGSYPEYSGVLVWFGVTVIGGGAISLPWPHSWNPLARAVSLSVAIMGLYSILQALGVDPLVLNAGAASGRVTATLGNPSNAGIYLLFALPFTIERLRRDTALTWRCIGGAAAVLAILTVVFSGSRGAWLGLLSAAVIWLAAEAPRWERARRKVALAALVVAVVALAAAVVAIPQLEKRVTSSSAATIQWRFVAWRAATQAALDRPFLGWGPNSFRTVYTSYWPSTVQAGASDAATVSDPHDIVMSAAASLGIPGAIGLLALIGLVGIACAGMVRRRGNDDLRSVAVCAALGGGLVALMFHYATLDTMAAAAVLLGLVVAAPETPGEPIAAGAHRWTLTLALALAGLLGAAALAAAGVVAADALMREGLAEAAAGAPWPSVTSRLDTAHTLAPWEPATRWAMGKAAIVALRNGTDRRTYSDGQRAFESTRRALPFERAVVYDAAYLMLRQGILNEDATAIHDAQGVFVRLSTADPNNPTYWSARAVAAESMGEMTEALLDIRIAIGLAPANTDYAAAQRQIESVARSRQ